jgi:hypothetical protein
MKQIKIIGFTLVAMFAISIVAAASASALEWLLNGKPIAAPVLVNSKSIGKLLLADLAAPSKGTFIECEGNDEGTVGPGDKDLVSSITATKCNFEKGRSGACEESKTVTAKALGLPWNTLLYTENGKTRDSITSEHGTAIGWNVECTVAGFFKVQDECTTKLASTAMANVTGGVSATFEASETASCTQGNSTSGMVIGSDLNENPGTTDIISTT